MTRARIGALQPLHDCAERADELLRERLGNEQLQRDEAREQLSNREDELAQADDAVAAHTSRIDALLEGRRALRIDVLLGWQEQLHEARARRSERAAALERAREAVEQIDATIANTRTEIMRNDARGKQCEARLAKLREEIARLDADREDEEAEEMLGARRLASRAPSAAVRNGDRR
jgi:chromosome segregation ATPase